METIYCVGALPLGGADGLDREEIGAVTSWENYIRDLVFQANPDGCALTNDSRADNIILSTFLAWGDKTFTRDGYVYVVFGEQCPEQVPYPPASTAAERADQVPDMTAACDAAFAAQPPLPPAGLFIQV